MAEARLAVAFKFSVSQEGEISFVIDRKAVKLVLFSIYRSLKRKVHKTRKYFHKSTYPGTSLSLLLTQMFILSMWFLNVYPLNSSIKSLRQFLPLSTEIAGLFLSCVFHGILFWFICSLLMQLVVKSILNSVIQQSTKNSSQRGAKLPLTLKLAMVFLSYVWGKNSGLYIYQSCLPRMSVPPLDKTIKKWLKSVKHLYSEEKYKDLEIKAMEFKNGPGRKLQRFLILRSYLTDNYISEWWEKYIYLSSRSPLPINSNYYVLDAPLVVTHSQASRAANLVSCLLTYRKMISDQSLKPILYNGFLPLCSDQYRRMFNTTRIPQDGCDILNHFGTSSHIVVLHKGCYYKIPLSLEGKQLNQCDFESIFEYLLNNPCECVGDEKYISALTSWDRDSWCSTRSQFFTTGINEYSIKMIDKATFVVCLEDYPANIDDYSNESISKLGSFVLHGNGHDRWYDKSLNVIVFSDARMGWNVEHTWADAAVISQLLEWVIFTSYRHGFNEDGSCKGTRNFDIQIKPERLQWDIPQSLSERLHTALSFAKSNIDDLHLEIIKFQTFGKGRIKALKTSPDAFMQLVIQLAFYRVMGHFDLTYEASMTRSFLKGRTETVRSCTAESCEFVREFVENNFENEIDKVYEAFRRAERSHLQNFRESMSGHGIDRHLFCLYVASFYYKEDVTFLKELLHEPWTLSTSQTPVGLNPEFSNVDAKNNYSAGGGFGPVCDKGYGVSYIISGEDSISIHVSSKRSCEETDSKVMIDNIEKGMIEVAEMLSLKLSKEKSEK